MKKIKLLLIIAGVLLTVLPVFAAFSSITISSSHDSSLSNDNTVNYSWGAVDTNDSWTLDGYKYLIDGSSDTNVSTGDTAISTTTITTGALSDGTYYFHIAPYGKTGSDQSVLGATDTFGPIKIDTTAPTLSGLSSSDGAYGAKVITLGATDTNMDGLKVYYTTNGDDINDSSLGTQYSTAFTIYSTTNFKIRAKDSAGNWSSQSSSSVTVSYTGNVPSISGVTADSTVATNTNGGATVLTASLTVGDNNVTNYEYQFDGGAYSSKTAVSQTIDISGLGDGSHTVYVVGYDSEDRKQNTADAQTLTFTVDNGKPSGYDAKVNGVSYDTKSTYGASINVVLSATDTYSATTIRYTTDGTTPSKDDDPYNGQAFTIESTTTIKMLAVDAVGNVGDAGSFTFTIDTIAPTGLKSFDSNGDLNSSNISYDSANNRFIYKTSADINLTSDDINASYFYTTNDTAPLTSSTPYNSSTGIVIADAGSTVLRYIAVDKAGNKAEEQTKRIIIDNDAPTAVTLKDEAISALDGSSNTAYDSDNSRYVYGPSQVFNLSATDLYSHDANGTIRYYYTTNGDTPTTTVSSTNKLYSGDINISTDGTTVVKVLATDLAGNSATVLSKEIYIDATAPVSLTATVTEGTSCGGATQCTEDINVTLSATDAFSGTTGLKIYYTLNSDIPTIASTLYSTPISITSTTTLKYIAVDKYSNQATGDTVNYTFSVNTAPTFDENVTDYSINEDADSFLIDLNATDNDDDAITYTLTSNNESIISVLSLGDGNFTLTPVANAFGDVTITATATANAQPVTQTFDINVSSVNDTPTISGTPLTTINEDSAYSFTVSSEDNDTVTGDTATYSISGNSGWMDINESTGVVSGTPLDADVGTTSNIVVTVTDTDGLTANLSAFSITVHNTNDTPIITGTPDSSVDEDSLYSFKPIATDGEANIEETLTFSIENKPSWASFSTADGNLSGTPTNGDVGTYSDINISVKDESNVTVSLSVFSIDVNNTNDAPVISGNPILTINKDEVYSFTPTASDVDSGDTLTFSIATKPSWADFNTSTGEINGTTTAGSNDINITVTDSNGSTDKLSYTLTVTNISSTTPVINTTFSDISKNEDFNQFSIPISINDVDIDDNLTLSIESNGSSVVSFTQTWDNNISQADYNNSQTFDLNITSIANKSGTVKFTVNLSDSAGLSVFKTFNLEINATNDTPVIIGIPDPTVEQDGLYSFTPSVDDNDTAEEGDTHTFSISSNKPDWLTFSPVDGNLSGTPTSGDIGTTNNIIITVIDGYGATDTLNFNLSVTDKNDIPVANDDNVSTDEDTVKVINPIIGSDTDADTADILKIIAITTPYNGTATITDSNFTITYTPNAEFSGDDNITYTISDGRGGEANATIYITIDNINDQPVINSTYGNIFMNEDNGTTSYDINISDVELEDLNLTVISNNTNLITVSQTWSDLLSSDEYNSTLLNFNLTTEANASGVAQITIILKDSNSTVYKSFNVNVAAVNDLPYLDEVALSLSTYEDNNKTTLVNVKEVDDGNVTITISDLNDSKGAVYLNGDLNTTVILDGNSINGSDLNITIVPALNYFGTYDFTMVFTDSNDTNVTKDINLTIIPVNDLPVIKASNGVDELNTTVITNEDNNLTLTYTIFDDENTLSDGNITIITPSNGTISDKNTTQLIYTPNPYFNGTDSFVINISDGSDDINKTINVTINPVNSAPSGFRLDSNSSNNSNYTMVFHTVFIDDSNESNMSVVIDINDTKGAITSSITMGDLNASGVRLGTAVITYTPNNTFVNKGDFSVLISDNEYNTTAIDINFTIELSSSIDSDGNGIMDIVEGSDDNDSDGITDYRDSDDDGDDFPDSDEIAFGSSRLVADDTNTTNLGVLTSGKVSLLSIRAIPSKLATYEGDDSIQAMWTLEDGVWKGYSSTSTEQDKITASSLSDDLNASKELDASKGVFVVVDTTNDSGNGLRTLTNNANTTKTYSRGWTIHGNDTGVSIAETSLTCDDATNDRVGAVLTLFNDVWGVYLKKEDNSTVSVGADIGGIKPNRGYMVWCVKGE